MAEGALRVTGATVALAVSGIAGPDGGTPDKPVGTVWFCAAARLGAAIDIIAEERLFAGDRAAVRRHSVQPCAAAHPAPRSAGAPGSPAAPAPPLKPRRATVDDAAAVLCAVAGRGGARRAHQCQRQRAGGCCGGRPLPAQNLHVTLAFLGAVERARLAELAHLRAHLRRGLWPAVTAGAALRAPRRTGGRSRSCVRSAAAVPTVAQRAGRRAQGWCSRRPDSVRISSPSGACDARAQGRARSPSCRVMRPVLWSFDAFALVESRTAAAGPIYSVIESYPLVSAQKLRT